MWLLHTDAASPANRSGVARAGIGEVADVVRRALATLAPTSGPARTAARTVITRHATTAPTAVIPTSGAPIPVRSVPATPTRVPPSLDDTGPHPAPDPVPGPAESTGRTFTTNTSFAVAPGSRQDEPRNVGLLVLNATPAATPNTTATGGTPTGLDDLIGNAATVIAPGGVLAVITTSDHRDGVLHDPRPALITSARAAGLDYWQHIVTTTRPDPYRPEYPGDDRHDDRHGDEGGRRVVRRREWRLVAEVSVFRRPSPGCGLGPAAGVGRSAESADIGDTEHAQPGQATTTEVPR